MSVGSQLVIDFIQTVKEDQERLVLIVGKPGSGKSKIMRELATNRGWKYIDCQTLVTDELLELVPKARPREAPHILDDMLSREKAEVVLLDGLQLLFAPLLNLNPLVLLRQLSKRHLIVAAWPGRFEAGKLSFLEPGRGEPYYYEAQDIKIIEIG
jgi:hypothetical protein